MDVPEIIRILSQPATPGGKAPTQAEVAAWIGVSQSTVSKWKSAQSFPDFQQTQKLRALAIKRGILTETHHDLTMHRTVKIVGAVGLGETIDWYAQGEGVSLELVELPFPVPEGCFALEARGNSMNPRVKDGEIIVARQNNNKIEEYIGQEVVLQVEDGTFLLKTLRRGYSAGVFNLESHNADPIEDARVVWMVEVWAIIPSRRWVRVG